MTINQEHGSVIHRALGALVLACLMFVHLQDWFPERTTWFTEGFGAMFVGMLVLAALASGKGRDAGDTSRWIDWSARASGALGVAALTVIHLMPSWHTPKRLAVVGMTAVIVAAAGMVAHRVSARPALCVAGAAMTLMLTTPLVYQGTPFFFPRDTLFTVVSLATFALFAIASVARLSTGVLVAGVVVSGVVMRYHGIAHHEIDAVHRDMLPLVQYGGEALLEGRNPYSILYWANHDLPMTYMPVMWLTYLPALMLGIDIRWTAVLATMVIAVVITRWANPTAGRGYDGMLDRCSSVGQLLRAVATRCVDFGSTTTSAQVGFAAVAIGLVLMPEVFWNSIHGEPIVYWMWLVLFLDAVRDRSPWRAAVTLGLLLAARHFSVLLIPFAALWFVLGQRDFKRGALWLLVAGALGCTILMAFFAGHPDSFLYGAYDWLVSYGPSRPMWWDVQIGFQQYFYHADRQSMLPYAQLTGYSLALATAATLSVRAALRDGSCTKRDVAIWLPLAPGYAAFVLFNSMIWKSFLIPIVVLAVFAAGLAVRTPERKDDPPGPLMRSVLEPRIYYPVMAVLALMLAWSATTIALAIKNHRDLTDVQRAAQYVAVRDVFKGDLLVDYSTVRAGHAPSQSQFEGALLAPDVARTFRMRSHDLTRFERIVLFDGFSRFDPDLDFPDLVRVTSRRIGRSSVHVFRPPHTMDPHCWKLSSDPPSITAAQLAGDKPPSFTGTSNAGRWSFAHRPDWNYVGLVNLRVVGRPQRLLWAHPSEGMTLRIEIALPGPGHAVLLTALDDFAIRPLHAPVQVRVLPGADGAGAVDVTHPNKTGRYFWGLGHLEVETIVLEIRTDNAAMRHFGFDVLVDPDDGADP